MKIRAKMMATGILIITRDQFCISELIAAVEDPKAPPILPLRVAESGRQAVLATI